MKISRELMVKAGVMPKLRLAKKRPAGGVESLGPQRVTLLEDKIIRGFDRDSNKETEFIVYTVEHKGEKKQYQTRLKKKGTEELNYLVSRLGEFSEGSEVILECKRAGVKNYIEVTPVGEQVEVDEVDHEEEDAPPESV